MLFALPPETISISRRRRRGSTLSALFRFVVVLLVLAAIGAGVYHFLPQDMREEGLARLQQLLNRPPSAPPPTAEERPLTGRVREVPQFNYRMQLPDEPWRGDETTKTALKAHLAMQRINPAAWLAVTAHDFSKTGTPRDAEMVDEAVRRLRGYFPNTLNYEVKDDLQLGGQRGQRLTFDGTGPDNTPMRGEGALLAHQGIGYWFFTWAPADAAAQAQKEYGDLRQRFSLMNKRDDWTEKRPTPQTLTGTKLTYTLQDPDDIWKKQGTPTFFDPTADMALNATESTNARDVDRIAEVLVLVLKAQPDRKPEAVARTYYEAQQRKKFPKSTFTVLSDRDEPIGAAAGHLTRLQVTNAPDRERFVMLAVVPRGEQLLVFQCDCDGKRRSLWERDFNLLLASFRVKE